MDDCGGSTGEEGIVNSKGKEGERREDLNEARMGETERACTTYCTIVLLYITAHNGTEKKKNKSTEILANPCQNGPPEKGFDQVPQSAHVYVS